MTVADLLAALQRFRGSDTLERNTRIISVSPRIGNLKVVRNGRYIGYVDLRTGAVETWEDDSDTDTFTIPRGRT